MLQDSWKKCKEAKNLHGRSSAEAWADWKILAVEASEFEYGRFARQLVQLQLTAVGKLSTDDELKFIKFHKRMKFLTEIKDYISSEFKVVPKDELDARLAA